MQNSDGGEFYEASSWEYSWYVPQDMASLVKTIGGPDTFRSVLRFKNSRPVSNEIAALVWTHSSRPVSMWVESRLVLAKLIRISRILVMSLVSVSHRLGLASALSLTNIFSSDISLQLRWSTGKNCRPGRFDNQTVL
jgi:hypothetical protein